MANDSGTVISFGLNERPPVATAAFVGLQHLLAVFGGILTAPLLVALGTSLFTAHMFIFYFAVASAITPPVAIAAFAASTISKSEPLATGFAAVRAGIVMFTIPFVFAFYPELLLIEQAQVAQSLDGAASAARSYLPGYDGTIDGLGLFWLLLRLALALYLVASALSRFDRVNLTRFEVPLRVALAVFVLWKTPLVANAALALAVIYLAYHHLVESRRQKQIRDSKTPVSSTAS